MKNILILTNSEHAYQGSGGRTRIISEIAVLKPLNLNIRILCIVPLKKFLKHVHIKKAASNLSQDSGVSVTVIPSIPTSHFVVLDKLSHGINAILLFFYSKRHKTEIIHAHGNFIAFSALLLKKFNSSIRLITDSHGCVAAEYKYSAENNDVSWVKWLEKIEASVINESDEVIFVSSQMKDYYINIYQRKIQSGHIINCASTIGRQLSITAREKKRKELAIDDKIVFVYLGSYRKYQMVEETIKIFIDIKKQLNSAHLLILTSHREVFLKALEISGLEKSEFTIESVSQNQVQNYLCAADFGFLLRDNSLVNKVSSPTKYAEYLMSGLPVLITEGVGDYSEFTALHNTGFVLRDFLCTPQLVSYVREVFDRREYFFNQCFETACNNLSWQQAGVVLKNIYTSQK